MKGTMLSRLSGMEKSRQTQEELRLLSHRLLSGQEEERKRVSRDLLDVIAQTLAGIDLRLTALDSQSIANSKDLHEKIAVTQRLVEQSVDIVHCFARDLRPAVLDDLGLIPALQSYIKGFAEQTGIRVALTSFAGVEILDSGVRTVLYRVVQEALTNVARHAKATQARVSIRSHRGTLMMTVSDDGQGFPVEEGKVAKSSKRVGLLGMRERVEMVGGTFCVESAPGVETTVRVEIPLAGAGRKSSKKSRSTPLQCL